MKARRLLWVLLLPVLLLLAWGTAEFFDQRPNPILVTVLPAGVASTRPEPAPPSGAPYTEVEVARSRAVRMKMEDPSFVGSPGGPVLTQQVAAEDAVAAEQVQLRAALDAWLAAPGRRLRIAQSWSGAEVTSWHVAAPQKVRVVLRARLEPVPRDAPR